MGNRVRFVVSGSRALNLTVATGENQFYCRKCSEKERRAYSQGGDEAATNYRPVREQYR